MTTTTLRPDVSKILALLSVGHSLDATSTHTGWPIARIRALVAGQKGWLIDTKGYVYNPGQPQYKAQLPEGVDPADEAWAQELLAAPPARAARQSASPKPVRVPQRESTRTATPPVPPVVGASAVDGLFVTDLPIAVLHGHAGNIRDEVTDLEELAASIAAHGILQPLTVHPHPDIRGEYQILAGHRRHAAALRAGLTRVPVIIRSEAKDGVAIEVMLVENVQRRDLSPMEKAEALGVLRDKHGYSNALISSRTGMSSSTVSGLLALLELDESSRKRVRDGEITATEAVAAVREMRRQRRGGKTDTEVGHWAWEPDFLAKTHPQARKAERMCNTRGHTSRRRIGKVACGQCWETVIRQDERLVVAAESEAS